MKDNNQLLFIVVGIVFGILNILSVTSSTWSGIIAVAEYLFLFSVIISKKYRLAFYYFLLFTCISIEQDGFITGDNVELLRYHFFRAPLISTYLFYFLPIFFFYVLRKKKKTELLVNKEVSRFRKWLILLSASGVLAIVIGMLFNDNGIVSSGLYPKRALLEILSFSTYLFVFLSSIEIIEEKEGRDELANYSILILVCVAISSLVSAFVFGQHGWYSTYVIMLTPIAIALTPFLVVLGARNSGYKKKPLLLITGLLIILATFIMPTCIGSKWYIIIFLALVGWILFTVKAKSIGVIATVAGALFAIVIFYSDTLLSAVSNDYVSYKLSQTLNLANMFDGSSSLSDSYYMLDNSTLYRFDEPANIFIEYQNKPLFSIFGKGFGGTTQHHTALLSWETDSGSFSSAETKTGAYFNMHETISIIFLRHGLLGVVFIIMVLTFLIKRLSKTPWALIAFVWFIFYWAYGLSSIVGAVATVLAISFNIEKGIDNNNNYNTIV